MTELPLEEQVLNLTPGSGETLSDIQPNKIINTIRKHWEENLQATLNSDMPVRLDFAQAQSLLTGLAKRRSMIQGPPGMLPLCNFPIHLSCTDLLRNWQVVHWRLDGQNIA